MQILRGYIHGLNQVISTQTYFQPKNTIKINKEESSAFAKHALDNFHHFGFENVQVLASKSDFHFSQQNGIKNAVYQQRRKSVQ